MSYNFELTARASAVSAAPGIGAVIADTGALPKGTYCVEWELAAQDTVAVGKGMVVEHRNAANAATVHRLGGCAAAGQIHGKAYVHIAENERIRVIAGTAAGAASSQYVAAISVYSII